MAQDGFYHGAKNILELRKKIGAAMEAGQVEIKTGSGTVPIGFAGEYANSLEMGMEYRLLKGACEGVESVDFDKERRKAKSKVKDYFEEVCRDSPELTPPDRSRLNS